MSAAAPRQTPGQSAPGQSAPGQSGTPGTSGTSGASGRTRNPGHAGHADHADHAGHADQPGQPARPGTLGCGHVVARELPGDRRRGAELKVVLGPRTVGSTSGFMGVATLLPGERIAEHYHPYSEEFLYVARGTIVVDCDGDPQVVAADEGLYIPTNMRHRLRNTGGVPASVIFHLGPLAPRPELGHVDTEDADGNPLPVPTGRHAAKPAVGS